MIPPSPTSNGSSDGSGDRIQVLVCDDHAVFRRGLTMVLEMESDIEVVGEAARGDLAVDLTLELLPDVVLMDVRMPGLSGIDATRRIRDLAPASRILMLTVSDEDKDLFDAVKAGAAGYLLKDVPIDDVAEAVRAVRAGHGLITPSMASKLMLEFSNLSRRADEKPVGTTAPPRLTEREREVLRHLATGMSNREISAVLFVSENTVKNHVRNILHKLQLHSRTEAVVYAVRENLIQLD
jgi:DNA-binding NarL/FixJ family response regulator